MASKGKPYTRAVLHRCQDEIFSVFSHRNPKEPIAVFIIFMDDDVCRCQGWNERLAIHLLKGRTLRCVETVITNHGVDVALLSETIIPRAGFRKPLLLVISIADFKLAGNFRSNLIKEPQGIRRPSNIGEFHILDHLGEATRIVVMVGPLCKRGVCMSDIHRHKITTLLKNINNSSFPAEIVNAH